MFPWLEIMRLSNAPTVASNVLVGIAIGMLARLPVQRAGEAPWPTALLLLGGALAVYLAGMVLNDVCDARVDGVERPGRPIPSGRVIAPVAAAVGLLLLAGGVVLLACAGPQLTPWALLLGASVLMYDVLHRQLPLAWLLPALCRALVVTMAAKAISPGADTQLQLWVAGTLFVFVALVGAAARDEMRGLRGLSRVAAGIAPVITLAPMGLLLLDVPDVTFTRGALAMGVLWFVAFPMALLAGRQARHGKRGIPMAIGGWLGTIPLLDAAACLLLDGPLLALACVGLWGLAGAMRPRIAPS